MICKTTTTATTSTAFTPISARVTCHSDNFEPEFFYNNSAGNSVALTFRMGMYGVVLYYAEPFWTIYHFKIKLIAIYSLWGFFMGNSSGNFSGNLFVSVSRCSSSFRQPNFKDTFLCFLFNFGEYLLCVSASVCKYIFEIFRLFCLYFSISVSSLSFFFLGR